MEPTQITMERERQRQFANMGELLDAARSGALSAHYLDAEDWARNGRFEDDGTWRRNGEVALRLTSRGLGAICSAYHYPRQGVERVAEAPKVWCGVMNHLIEDPDAMHDQRLVAYDTASGPVVTGLVSDRYGRYDNRQFIMDVNAIGGDTAQVKRARLYGTRLRIDLAGPEIRFLSDIPGVGEDIAELGLSIGNSMGGECRLYIETLVTRTICANGMRGVGARWGAAQRIHRGEEEAFREKVRRWCEEAKERYRESEETIRAMSNTMVDIGQVASNEELTNSILDAIPGLRKRLDTTDVNDAGGLDTTEGRERALRHLPGLAGDVEEQLREPPKTVWQWMNIITAHARRSEDQSGDPGMIRELMERNAARLGEQLTEVLRETESSKVGQAQTA